MNEKEFLTIIKILSQTGGDGRFSLTTLLHELDRAQQENAVIVSHFYAEFEDTLLWFLARRTSLCAKIQVIPDERKVVGQILARVNIKSFSENYPKSVQSLNRKFVETKLSFVAPTLDLPTWSKMINDAQKIHVGIVNLYLLSVRETLEPIVPLTRKFFSFSVENLQQRVSSLENAYKEFITNAPIIDKMRPIAVEQLLGLGHLQVSLDNMQVLHLGQVLYREMLAAKNVFELRQEKSGNEKNLSDSIIRDHIALNRVKETYDELS